VTGRVGAWAGLLGGVAIVIAVAVTLATTGPVEEFGDVPAAIGAPTATDPAGDGAPTGRASRTTPPPEQDEPAPPPGAEAAAEDEPAPDPGDDAATFDDAATSPGVLARSARLADVEARTAPTSIRIEGLGIAAPVDAVGTHPDGTMEIPEDVRRAGWYRHGSSPGETSGSTVVTSHVDSEDQGPGAFFELPEVSRGDRIELETDHGTVAYAVTALTRYGKEELPIADLFLTSGPHRLVLITCGGDFDPATRSYAENVVVIAEPIG
jgi:hypothetical protein